MSDLKLFGYRLSWLKNDIPGGFSVFLVALPLCMGIAMASGAPIYSGILSGIIGGLVVSIVSGSHLGVSGPAAGLSSVVAASIISLGDYKIFLLAVVVAGIFQLFLGLFKLGIIASYFPSSVIKGLLAAIGIIIISKQIAPAIGYDQSDFWEQGFAPLFTGRLSEHLKILEDHISNGSIIITVICLIVLVVLQRPFARKLRVIPAPLVAVLIGVTLNEIFKHTDAESSLQPVALVNIPPDIFSNISFPDFGQLFSSPEIWKDGLIIGILATLETLLCVEAVDKLDKHNRITPSNRELIAQGTGNILCGLLGALPMTAVVVRGAANADAGGRTKLSAFIHGLLLLLAILLVPFLLNMIPYASLAAILIITGLNLTKPVLYKNVWKLGLKQFIPFITTVVCIIITDLMIGVAIGLLISIYFILQNNFKVNYKIIESKENNIQRFLIKLHTNVTFLNKVKLRKALDRIPVGSELTIDGRECDFIDYDILEIISEYSTKAHDRNIDLHLKGIKKIEVIYTH